MPICRRTSAPVTSRLSARYFTAPSVGRTSVDKMPSSVVFPAPLWPSSAHIDFAPSSTVTPARARSLPYRLTTLAIWTRVIAATLVPDALELGEHLVAALGIEVRLLELD